MFDGARPGVPFGIGLKSILQPEGITNQADCIAYQQRRVSEVETCYLIRSIKVRKQAAGQMMSLACNCDGLVEELVVNYQ
jgi:hypothetical protein